MHEDAILTRFRDALAALYGERLQRVVLFGSRARGDAGESSDYDVAVFLDRVDGFAIEAERLATIETGVLVGTGAVVNAIPFASESYAERTAFMAELHRDGREL